MAKLMTSINQIEGGDVLKSGDTTSVFGFEILGYDGKRMELSGTGKLTLLNDENVALYQDVTVENGRFSFSMGNAVGADIKEIKASIANKTVGVSEERLTQAITQVKADIIGGAPENLNTLKEIADNIEAAGGNTNSGIISKMTELGTRIDTIEQEDLVSVYNTAKA